ncbi:hypothetical protein [Mycobacterium kyorinense]|nr:hypothetical protein [Mycobacterium kyorinense]
MTAKPDDELAEARRDYTAAQYVVALFTGDPRLTREVYRRVAGYR